MSEKQKSEVRIPVTCPACGSIEGVFIGADLFMAAIQIGIALRPLTLDQRRALWRALEFGMCGEENQSR